MTDKKENDQEQLVKGHKNTVATSASLVQVQGDLNTVNAKKGVREIHIAGDQNTANGGPDSNLLASEKGTKNTLKGGKGLDRFEIRADAARALHATVGDLEAGETVSIFSAGLVNARNDACVTFTVGDKGGLQAVFCDSASKNLIVDLPGLEEKDLERLKVDYGGGGGLGTPAAVIYLGP